MICGSNCIIYAFFVWCINLGLVFSSDGWFGFASYMCLYYNEVLFMPYVEFLLSTSLF